MIAAKQFDPVVGIDIHIIQPPGPVPPVPVPHPFVGILLDPFDFAPIIGGTVMVNGIPRATAGTGGKCIPPHIPIGGVFVKPPGNECEVFMGSSTVLADGEPLSSLGMPALSCHDVGMPPPPRIKKKKAPTSLFLPTSVVMSVPAGAPVLVGGPPTISMMALGMRAGMAGFGKAFKKVGKRLKRGFKKARQKAFKNVKPGFLKCKVLRAEPVNVVTGEVVVEQQDFELPWRIPLNWTRLYHSGSTRAGTCGWGWETPADARLEFDDDGIVSFYDGTPGAAVFPHSPAYGPVMEFVNGAVLREFPDRFTVRTKQGLDYHFPKLAEGARETLVSYATDRCGNSIEFVRSGSSLQQIRESSGIRIQVTSVAGRIRRMMLHHPLEPRPRRLVEYDYDGDDLVTVRDPLGSPYRFTYDHHRMIRHTNRVGLSFHYAFDGPERDARCTRSWGDGRLYDYTFQYGDGWTRYTDSLGNHWRCEHTDGLITHEIDPLGSETRYSHDDHGRTTAVEGPTGARTEYAYDDMGNAVEIVNAAGAATSDRYDERGNLVAHVTAEGGEWTQTWTRADKLERRVSPSGATISFEYGDHGDLTAVVGPDGGRRVLGRDRHGRIVSETDPLGRTWRWSHDAFDRPVRAIDPWGRLTEYGYDLCGRCKFVRRPSGRTERFEYDAEGNPTTIQDPSGNVTRAEYFGLGEIAARIEPDGTRTSFRYDTEERLIEVANPEAGVYRIERDAVGRIVAERDYWGGERRFELDAAGNVARAVDALGREVRYEHDAIGRVVARETDAGEREEFDYSLAGRRTGGRNSAREVIRQFDPDGRLVSERQGDFQVAFEYNAAGRLAKRRSSIGNEVAYDWNLGGELTAIHVNGRPLMRSDSTSDAHLHREVLGDDLLREEHLDPDGRLLRQSMRRHRNVLVEREFVLNVDGQLTAMHDSLRGAVAWEHDARGRRRRETWSHTPAMEFRYGAAGGRLLPSSNGDHSPNRRSATSDGVTYHFDAAGQLREKASVDGIMELEWDGYGRLAATRNGMRLRMSYDAFGRRTVKDSSVHVEFYWEGNRLLAEHGPDGWKEYVYYPDSYVLLGVVTQNGIYVCHAGPGGSPWECFAPSGELQWAVRYSGVGATEAIGEVRFNIPLRLQGQYEDAESGLYYNRFRYYDPIAGAYLSQDPLRLAGGEDLYSYGPTIDEWIDPLGLACYTAKSRTHVFTHGHAANSPRIPNKSRFRPTEGGQKFTDDVVNHPNVVTTPQSNGRIKYEVADLADPPNTPQRITGWDQSGNPVHGGTVIVEGPTPASWSNYSPDEVVTQFPT